MVLREQRSAPRIRWAALGAVLAGIFLALFGVGSGLWWTSFLGGALLVTAGGLAVTGVVVERDRHVVFGQAYVVEAPPAPVDGVLGRCEMLLAVEAPGLQAVSILVRDPRVPIANWPAAGTVLPVRVAPRNPRRLQVLWDRVSATPSASSPR